MKEYFSRQSAEYAKYRPRYPAELFTYLASLTPHHDCAVDCATGNGQAAVGLANHFLKVIATDMSEAQLAGAFRHPHITYLVSRAEHLDVPAGSVDLVTVAQALHWFHLEDFYNEVRRITKPAGVVAVWTYDLLTVDPAVDRIITSYHDEIVGPHWPPERHYIRDGYRSLPFPFREISPRTISMESRWDLEHLFGFLFSWSGTQRYIDATGKNPLERIDREMRSAWGSAAQKTIRWPLNMRIGFMQ